MVGGNEDGAFAIDGTSGELSVVDNSVLDFISNPTYFLDVQVQDDGEGELTDQAVIAVSGDNVNLAPNIENQISVLQKIVQLANWLALWLPMTSILNNH
ncbi:MAG: cadherin repeat domain-containing protein [Bacteroidales bacterium]